MSARRGAADIGQERAPVTRMPCGAAQRSTTLRPSWYRTRPPCAARPAAPGNSRQMTGAARRSDGEGQPWHARPTSGPGPLPASPPARPAAPDEPNGTAGHRHHSSAQTCPAWPRPAGPGPRRPRPGHPGIPKDRPTVLRPKNPQRQERGQWPGRPVCDLIAQTRYPVTGSLPGGRARTAPATTGRPAHGGGCKRATRPAAGSSTRRQTTTTGE